VVGWLDLGERAVIANRLGVAYEEKGFHDGERDQQTYNVSSLY